MTNSISVYEEVNDRTFFGFWVYIMTDCILFAILFAAYAVLHNNTYGGPSSHDLFSPSFVLAETMLLLLSSFTSGLAMLSTHKKDKNKVIWWFFVTFLLGAGFVGLELWEFFHLIGEGYTWKTSGFLTAFFTLVGTHGLHVSLGLLWMIVLIVPVMKNGLNHVNLKRLTCLKMFWHFLDVVWIFIFTLIYLMGVI